MPLASMVSCAVKMKREEATFGRWGKRCYVCGVPEECRNTAVESCYNHSITECSYVKDVFFDRMASIAWRSEGGSWWTNDGRKHYYWKGKTILLDVKSAVTGRTLTTMRWRPLTGLYDIERRPVFTKLDVYEELLEKGIITDTQQLKVMPNPYPWVIDVWARPEVWAEFIMTPTVYVLILPYNNLTIPQWKPRPSERVLMKNNIDWIIFRLHELTPRFESRGRVGALHEDERKWEDEPPPGGGTLPRPNRSRVKGKTTRELKVQSWGSRKRLCSEPWQLERTTLP